MRCPFCKYEHENEGDRYGCPNCEGQAVERKFMSEPKKRGAPYKPEDEKASSYLHLRVRQEDKARWVRQAQASGQKLAEWVRDRLDDTGNA